MDASFINTVEDMVDQLNSNTMLGSDTVPLAFGWRSKGGSVHLMTQLLSAWDRSRAGSKAECSSVSFLLSPFCVTVTGCDG